ncbi:type II toxin-antitoxin system RelE/ParE family toxin [Jiella endophytica]|uniref:Type II toxin-antitoxin system RelE/ParE family toxin n=1 Tax=Jiella endophytica TaxID=2558362 RepID=A0A4Y8RV09_9HYPH|nr:type II toxin-antitoxin system RelE/ParE family toxin [Jiella endophytica]TFF27793.1 type II toxin-antitoxin system RelE/ParE family toxin [Jiella endophytica]
MVDTRKTLHAAFYASASGRRPVREWLMDLPPADRKTIGEDIATLEFSWPIGRPKCAAIAGQKNMFEVRSNISSGRIARVLFVIIGHEMILLHAFVKKTQRLPEKDLRLAITRMRDVNRNGQQ